MVESPILYNLPVVLRCWDPLGEQRTALSRPPILEYTFLIGLGVTRFCESCMNNVDEQHLNTHFLTSKQSDKSKIVKKKLKFKIQVQLFFYLLCFFVYSFISILFP